MKMTSRDTGTGDVLERMILPTLEQGGYTWMRKVNVGKRPTGGKHVIDAIATKDNQNILISQKYQQVSGSTEEKIAYEIISLLKALKENEEKYIRAYLVLAGKGWSHRNFYVEGGLNDYIVDAEKIKIVTLEDFMYLANKGIL